VNGAILGAPAPAKLNLFLHVTGRRADGYHMLQTVFTFIDYGDTLDFEATQDGRITQRAPLVGITPEGDLCLKAAQALQRASGCEQGVVIGLNKRIPLGGGLGGGSSNFTLASAGPALFLLMAQVTGKLRAKPSVSRKRREGRLIETKTLIRSV